MSTPAQFNPTEILATLIRYGETLLRDGDEFGPLSPEQRVAVSAAVAGWRDRFNRYHLAAIGDRVTSDTLFDLAMMADAMVLSGDGGVDPMSDEDLSHSFSFRSVVVGRGSQAPGGERTARILSRSPISTSATRRVSEARLRLQAGRSVNLPATPIYSPPAARPAASPPPAAGANVLGPDALVFGGGEPAPQSAPDPQKPAPAPPAGTGTPAQAA